MNFFAGFASTLRCIPTCNTCRPVTISPGALTMTEDATDVPDEDAELEEAIDRATHACQMASGVVPAPLNWGAWMYSDAHPAMGGGVGGFVWFDTRDEMLAFFHEHLPYLDQGILSRHDAYEIAEACQAIVDMVRDGSVELRVGMTRLNHVVRGLTVIQWWGQLEDLHTSDAAFPCNVRSRFRKESTHDRDESSEITANEETAFAEYLRTMI
jgi:hypothetical protein